MNRAARLGILAASVTIFCYVGIGHVLGRTPDDKAYKSLTVYGEVLQKIQADYVDEPNMHLVTAGALPRFLGSVGPPARHPAPREDTAFKQKMQSGRTGGTRPNLSHHIGDVI